MAKSFSIKVGADTGDFLKDLRKADSQIRTTSRLGDELNKSLDLKFNANTAVQAQKAYQTALEQTEKKAQALREQLAHMEKAGQVDTTNYERIQTELAKAESQAVTLTKKLEEVKNVKVEQIADKFEKVGDKIEGAGKKLLGFSAAAAGALGGATKLAKDAVNTGDEIQTLADKYDMTTKAIQQWQYVALQSDISSENLYKAAQKTQQAFGQQLVGTTNAATKALEYLNLSVSDFDSNEQAFAAVVGALGKIENQAEQAAIATDLFGAKQATDLIPLFKQSEKAIAGYLNEFEQVGYLSDEQVKQLAALDNEINKVTAQFNQAKTELGIALIPVYQALVTILEESVIPAIKSLADWFGNLDPKMQNTIIGILGIIAVAAPLLIMVGKIAKGIGALMPLLAKLKSMTLATAAGFAALGGAVALSFDLIMNWGKMSTIEKVLKSITVAVLAAAAAVMVFHASWSLGIAVGAAVAGIAAALGAINAASKKITGQEIASGGGDMPSAEEYDLNALKSQIANNYDNSTNYNNNGANNYYITINADTNASAEDIADIVSRKIATLAQSRG